ncbi:MAG TPA: 4-alpha-glucanotransferase [Gemmatimonadaceae bacterium]
MPTKSRKSASERLAETVGIIPKYLDQTGTEWRKCAPESRAAILSAMGLDVSTESSAERALRALRQVERAELIAPVHIVQRDDDTATRHVEARLASPPNGEARWQLTLILENGVTRSAEGRWGRGMHAELPIPWPTYPPLGYHRLDLTVTIAGEERTGEQTLIIVPPRCVQPSEKLGNARAFGVVANLYTVRSDRNWGVGDVSDLKQLAQWMGDVHGAFVGVNPLHALANHGKDISPYSPVSRLFRNPIYIDVENVPELHVAPRIAARIDHPEFEAELSALRENPEVQYEEVMALKRPVLEELHRVFVEREQATGTARGVAYDDFVKAQEPELTRFATFSAIAESLENWHWQEWPQELQNVHSDAVQRFQREHAERVDLHRWIQFELDRQLREAANVARQSGLPIGLYQDLAIGTSPTGADSWAQPELFIQHASIGAAPDPYSSSGQNWGLPPIDPMALRRDRYRYFIRLVRNGFRHAGALRIDHVMGLFRQFWIPEGMTGKEGAYVAYPSDDLLGILALESVRQDALVVGEDLGTVPDDVPPALERWGVLSSKVLYFEREKGGFSPAEKYAPLALATANTHDMATLAGFWAGRDIELRAHVGLIESDKALSEARAAREQDKGALLARLAKEGVLDEAAAPNDSADLRGAIHEFLCRTPAALVGLALDDLAGEMDAVNLPGVGPDKHPSWKRKMGMTIDDMRASEAVNKALRCTERQARGA